MNSFYQISLKATVANLKLALLETGLLICILDEPHDRQAIQHSGGPIAMKGKGGMVHIE